MPILQEQHTFASVNGGYQCMTCNAFIAQNILVANTLTEATLNESQECDLETVLNQAYRTAGLP